MAELKGCVIYELYWGYLVYHSSTKHLQGTAVRHKNQLRLDLTMCASLYHNSSNI